MMREREYSMSVWPEEGERVWRYMCDGMRGRVYGDVCVAGMVISV